jgi:taurine dioxygenase
MPVEKQDLRIMHRSTVRGVEDLAPKFGLPIYVEINTVNPSKHGVWKGGGVGFRWDESIPMQN